MHTWLRSLLAKTKMTVMVTTLVAAQLVAAVTPFTATASATPVGNNGTLKVHEQGTPSGTENEDPKVCIFNVEGFSFDPAQTGYLEFDVQGGDGPTGVAAGPYSFGPTDQSGYYASQYFQLQPGHYKATLYGKDTQGHINLSDEKAKSKVFKVTCSLPTITTQASSQTINLGQSVSDSATLSGITGTVSGSVKFYVCGPTASNPDCTTGGTAVGNAVTVTNGQAASSMYTPSTLGNYCFRAEYTPDNSALYYAQTHTNTTTECFSVCPTLGSITIIKDALPNSSQAFNFTATGNGVSNFSLTDNSSPSNTKTFSSLNPGTYSFTESATTGWDFDNINCGATTVQKNGSSVTITLAAGQSVSCTYTNRQRAHLVVHKVTNPANDTTGFQITASGTPLASGATAVNGNATRTLSTSQDVTYDVAQGTYNVSEAATIGWTQASNSCMNVVIDANTPQVSGVPTITCTITNTKLGSISGTKYEANADGSNVQVLSGWTIKLYDGNTLVGTTVTDSHGNYSFTGLLPKNYNVIEVLTSGWTQIYHPGSINLTAGQKSSTNNFGNFKDGSISGYKWNDANGNGRYDNHESKLSNWTITLSQNGYQIRSTQTDKNGDYSFNNLAPGTYLVCEGQKTGWVQTYPGGNGCHTIVINMSGEENCEANFGNQGHGSITVIKNVDNGYGYVDHNVTNWSWDIDGGSSHSTGSMNKQAVAAGSYTVSEHQKTDYHVTASSCTGQDGHYVSVSQHVSVAPGQDIVCTFTNTRDTGTINVTKHLLPWNDNGKFNLQIDNMTKKANVGNNGTTGDVKVLTGWHNVRETAGSQTYMSEYDSSYICYDGYQVVLHGDGTATPNFMVRTGHEVDCIFTNVKHASVTIIKDAQPDSSQPFTFTLKRVDMDKHHDDNKNNNFFDVTNLKQDNDVIKHFTLIDDGDSVNSNSTTLSTGVYEVDETATANWDLTKISCNAAVWKDLDSGRVSFALLPGQHLICTFTNVRQTGTITVNKVVNPATDSGKFNLQIDGTTDAQNVGNGGTTGAQVLFTGSHAVSETAGTDTNLSDYISTYSCSNEVSGSGTEIPAFKLYKNQHVTCTFTNVRKAQLTVIKKAYPANSSQHFNFSLEQVATPVDEEGITQLNSDDSQTFAKSFILDDNNDPTYSNSNTTELAPGNYQVTEASTDGWDLTSMDCGDVVTTKTGATISFQLVAGEQLSCTFTNQKHVTPQVLGASTTVTPTSTLVNTGLPLIGYAIAAMSLLGTALFVTTRRSNRSVNTK